MTSSNTIKNIPTRHEIAAIQDAINYTSNVVDDRMESVISSDRKKKIIIIVENYLKGITYD